MKNMARYMSIVTNFGCHYKCPYCVVKENNLRIPVTTLPGLDNLSQSLRDNNCNILSISGGGDPLYQYEMHVDWYRKLFSIVQNHIVYFLDKQSPIPIEMHTGYMTDESTFPFYDCYRVVYHANTIDQLSRIHRTGNEIVRAVFVVTEDFTIEDIMNIAIFVHKSEDIDELSFRQLVDGNYKEKHYLEDYLKMGHRKLWWYIEQNDYNFYYAENKVITRYKDFKEVSYEK